MMKDVEIQPHTCPVCGTVNDAVLCPDDVDTVVPLPGDLSICIECFAIGVFMGEGKVRIATSEECNDVPVWLRERLTMRERGRKPS